MCLNTRQYDVRGPQARPRVDANLFDGSHGRGPQPSGFTSCNFLSQASTSRGHMSSNYETFEDALEACKANKKEPITDADAPIDNYPGGPFDTSLLHLYRYHAARHVWEVEVYLFTFALHVF